MVEEYSRPQHQLLVLSGTILAQVVVALTWPHDASRGIIQHLFLLATVGAAAWFASAIVNATIYSVRLRHPIDGDRDEDTRRLHTQLSLIRGFVNAAIWLIALGFAFFTIPGAEAVGTSILASAGVASLIAGIAAQSLLGNVFAGLQLAFSGSVRVGDLVVANEQSGRVEEVTLTTVVVKLWDGRRLVLPSTYFTTTPFENWTHGSSDLLGAIDFDVDWRIQPSAMRKRLDEILTTSDLWDGRSGGLTVESATGGMVRVRALVSAADAAQLVSLRNLVREQLVEWVTEQSDQAIPVQRVLSESTIREISA